MKKLISTFAVVFFSTIVLIGCSSEVNKDNYDKIKTDMTISEVESILGEGESSGASNIAGVGDYDVKTWSDGMKVISITFSNGKVAAKVQAGL